MISIITCKMIVRINEIKFAERLTVPMTQNAWKETYPEVESGLFSYERACEPVFPDSVDTINHPAVPTRTKGSPMSPPSPFSSTSPWHPAILLPNLSNPPCHFTSIVTVSLHAPHCRVWTVPSWQNWPLHIPLCLLCRGLSTEQISVWPPAPCL